jgi:hypothetical protein
MAGYDLAGMERAVQQCDKNIRVFEEAIEKEKRTKAEYQEIVTKIKEKAASAALAIAVPKSQ